MRSATCTDSYARTSQVRSTGEVMIRSAPRRTALSRQAGLPSTVSFVHLSWYMADRGAVQSLQPRCMNLKRRRMRLRRTRTSWRSSSERWFRCACGKPSDRLRLGLVLIQTIRAGVMRLYGAISPPFFILLKDSFVGSLASDSHVARRYSKASSCREGRSGGAKGVHS